MAGDRSRFAIFATRSRRRTTVRWNSRWRTCVHEAAHLVIDVIHFGPNGLYATTARVGMPVRIDGDRFVGTADNHRRRLQVILAGRAGEELLLGTASHGAGGAQGSDLDKATSLAAGMVGSD